MYGFHCLIYKIACVMGEIFYSVWNIDGISCVLIQVEENFIF